MCRVCLFHSHVVCSTKACNSANRTDCWRDTKAKDVNVGGYQIHSQDTVEECLTYTYTWRNYIARIRTIQAQVFHIIIISFKILSAYVIWQAEKSEAQRASDGQVNYQLNFFSSKQGTWL